MGAREKGYAMVSCVTIMFAIALSPPIAVADDANPTVIQTPAEVTEKAASGETIAEPTPAQWRSIINLSGRQRMLTQKMTKEYLLVLAGHNATENRDNLRKTIDLFDTTLGALVDGDDAQNLPPTTNGRILSQLETINREWTTLRGLLEPVASGRAATSADIEKVAAQNLVVLGQMNKAVKMYERTARRGASGGSGAAVRINLAGRQRMLTQRMSKEFLLIHLGVSPKQNAINLRESILLFDLTLEGLLHGDTDLELNATGEDDIRTQLETVHTLWKSFESGVMHILQDDTAVDAAALTAVASENMPLLKNMHKAVQMIQNAGAQEAG